MLCDISHLELSSKFLLQVGMCPLVHSPSSYPAFPRPEVLLVIVIMLKPIVVPSLGLLKYASSLSQSGKSSRLKGELVQPEERDWILRDLRRVGGCRVTRILSHTWEEAGWGYSMAPGFWAHVLYIGSYVEGSRSQASHWGQGSHE